MAFEMSARRIKACLTFPPFNAWNFATDNKNGKTNCAQFSCRFYFVILLLPPLTVSLFGITNT